jgi:DNA polymerase V
LAFSDESYGDGVSVHAGFPNPALDRRRAGVQISLDLNQHLIKRPGSSFLFRVAGHTWASDGVFDGDIAIIDRALTPQVTDLVIIWQSSGFSLSRQRQLGIEDEPLGVVTSIIHQYHQ